MSACASRPPPARMKTAGVFSAIPRHCPTLPASRAADPDAVAGPDGRPRHRPLCLCARAARYARHAGLVVLRGRFHEHDQRGRLSRGRPARLAHDRAFRACGLGALGHAGLRAVAGAVRGFRKFLRPEFRGGCWRASALRPASSAAGRWRQRSRSPAPNGRTSCSACSMPGPASASCRRDWWRRSSCSGSARVRGGSSGGR